MLYRLVLCTFLFVSYTFGQENDRIRYKSEVYDQQNQIKKSLEASVFRIGPLWVTPQIGISNFGFDSNVFSSKEEIDDITGSPMLGVKTFLRLSERWYWANDVDMNYLWYKDSDLGGSEVLMKSRMYGFFQRAFVEWGGDYQNNYRRINSEISQKAKNKKKGLNFRTTFLTSNRSFLKIAGQIGTIEYEQSDLSYLQGRDYQEVSINFLYKLTPKLWPFIEVKHRESDFSDKSQGTQTQEVALGFRNSFGIRFHYNLKVGFTGIEARDNDLGLEVSDGELTMRSFAKYQFPSRWFLEFGYNRWITESNSIVYPSYLSKRALFGFGYKTIKGMEIGPDIYIGENQYSSSFQDEISGLRVDDFVSANLNLVIPFRNTQLKWGIVLGYEEKTSEIENGTYSGFYTFTDFDYRF